MDDKPNREGLESRIEMISTSEGVRLAIQAQPGSRKNGLNGVHDGRLKIAITQVAEKGKANQVILQLLGKLLELPKSQLSIVSGELNSKKQVLISGISKDALLEKISEHLPQR